MKEIKVCVGSSCFLRGAQEVIVSLQTLIKRHGQGKLTLKGMFCQEKCTLGVTIMIGDRVFSGVSPADVEELFMEYVLYERDSSEKEDNL